MNGKQKLIGWMFFMITSAPTLLAQAVAVRTLPGEVYLPGESHTITIEITGDPGAITVVEIPPQDWSTHALSGGKLEFGRIIWNLDSFRGSTTLMYNVTPPMTETGEAVFSGTANDQEIVGMTRMTQFKMPTNLRLPQTTGPYAIGTFMLHLIDESREEKFTSDTNDHRELMIQTFYPADIQDSRQAGLISPNFGVTVRPYFEAWPVPIVFWDCVEALVGNAVWDASVLDFGIQYPIVIYTHGHMANRHNNLYLLEELASHGYIVVTIDHPYNATAVHFPDGRIISTRAGDWSSYINLHVQDVRFILDQMELNGVGRGFSYFGNVIDLRNIGLLGMSLGRSYPTIS